MTDNIITPETNNVIPETNVTSDDKPTMSYVLEQVAKINFQTVYLNQAIEQLGKMADGEAGEACSPGNIAGQAKAQALGDVVRCRETTNQQLLKFYEKMYDDIKKPYHHEFNVYKERVEFMNELMQQMNLDSIPAEFRKMILDKFKADINRI